MSAYPLVNKVKKQVMDLIRRIIFYPEVRDRIIYNLVQNDESRKWLMHRLTRYQIREASFDRVPIDRLNEIKGFEDCYWLFSSNDFNLSLSQLRFDDAAYLYQQLHSYNHPRIAELGRYKGGTTFLLAAAGAEVLSLEFNPETEERYLPSLKRVLYHFGLDNLVDARFDDAYTYDPGQNTFDFVLVHCSPPTYEHTRNLVRHWWAFIRTGGYLILHETPFLPGEQEFIEEMRNTVEAWNAELKPNTPGENVYFKKLGEFEQVNMKRYSNREMSY